MTFSFDLRPAKESINFNEKFSYAVRFKADASKSSAKLFQLNLYFILIVGFQVGISNCSTSIDAHHQ